MPDKDEKSNIKFGQTYILEKDLALFYYARRKFNYKGRPLTREECNDLISCKMKPKKPVNAVQHEVYDIFDNDTHDMTKSLEKRAQKEEASLLAEVTRIHKSLLDDNKDFKDRSKILEGFGGKMSDRLTLDGKDILTMGGNRKALRVDELYLLYHLFRYVEVEEGKPIEEGQVRAAWQRRVVGMEIRASNPAFRTLEQPGNSVTRAIASEITLKEHDFFSNRAAQWYQTYDPDARLNQRYFDDCKTYPKVPLPEDMAALTVTAGPSNQPAPARSNTADFPTQPPPAEKRGRETDSSSPGSGEGPSKGTQEPNLKGKGREEMKGKEHKGKRPRGSG